MIKEINGKRYQLGGVFRSKTAANQEAKAYRASGSYASISTHHLTERGTEPHPSDRSKKNAFYRVWYRKK